MSNTPLDIAMAAYLEGTGNGGYLISAMRVAGLPDNVVGFFCKLHDITSAQAGELRRIKRVQPILEKTFSFSEENEKCFLLINTRVTEMPVTLWRDVCRLCYASHNVFESDGKTFVGQKFALVPENKEAATRLLKGALYVEGKPIQ